MSLAPRVLVVSALLAALPSWAGDARLTRRARLYDTATADHIVDRLDADEVVTLLEADDSGDYVRVRTSNRVDGYVYARFLVESRSPSRAAANTVPAPTPLVEVDHPVDWWFVFKPKAAAFEGCADGDQPACLFGGKVQNYIFGQHYFVASSDAPTLVEGPGCVGDTLGDPLGATFDELYNGDFYYVVWNDQFFGDPELDGCSNNCASPWGHSKGMLAWNEHGDGVVLQVSTPSWPGAGSHDHPREEDGNTLGCVIDDNVKVAQHFFSLRLTDTDVVAVVTALANASVATDPSNYQLVRNGGPPEIRDIVATLGTKIASGEMLSTVLSTDVQLISKPSSLHVPPWQGVSSVLDATPLRVATWWSYPQIPSTDQNTAIGCWDSSLGPSGPVEIATSGAWDGVAFGLRGGSNHAKIGVSTDAAQPLTIFGDLNQQGALHDNCDSSQNGRGGLFFVVDNKLLHASVSALIAGDSAPL